MQANNKTALIFFSRKASYEGRMKQFVKNSPIQNQKISAALIARAEKTLQESALPVFHFHQGNQSGNSFGEKLANAYQEIFDLGYDNLIAVGNDSPELAAIDWNEIQNKLDTGKSVLGPNFRGGTYLIALPKSQFRKEEFAALSWQTNQLFNALENYCNTEENNPFVLEKFRDINTHFDLKIFSKSYFFDPAFKKLIQWIISAKNLLFFKHPLRIFTSPILIYSPFRGPPSAY